MTPLGRARVFRLAARAVAGHASAEEVRELAAACPVLLDDLRRAEEAAVLAICRETLARGSMP